MAIVPIFVGSALGGFNWWQLLLLFSWILAFQFFDAFGLLVQSVLPRRNFARGKKYLPAVITHGCVAAVGAIILVAFHPELLWFALALIPLVAVALYEMLAGRPRSFLARTSAIIASCLLTPMAFSLGSHPSSWHPAWVATAVLAAYFIGTVPYVKTMIRERGNPTWLRFSITYHVVIAAAASVLALLGQVSPWIAASFAILAVRAWGFPYLSRRNGKPLRPALFGSSEFFFCAMVVAAILLG